MNQLVTSGIVLRRIDYQEADRILTILTPDQGKIGLIAKGARRAKSKLAGGIELFSISDITFISGRKDIGTLTSSRLKRHFPHITADIDRTMLGYDFLKQIDRITEQASEAGYFDLLEAALSGLDEEQLSLELCELWFSLQLLKLTGHSPNLRTDESGKKLVADERYNFDFGDMQFMKHSAGRYEAGHIKLLRLAISQSSPVKLLNLQYDETVCNDDLLLAKQAVQTLL